MTRIVVLLASYPHRRPGTVHAQIHVGDAAQAQGRRDGLREHHQLRPSVLPERLSSGASTLTTTSCSTISRPLEGGRALTIWTAKRARVRPGCATPATAPATSAST